MKTIYYKINCLFPEEGTEQLNACLSAYAISSVKECFVDDGQDSFWSVRVAIVENSTKSPVEPAKPIKPDNRNNNIGFRLTGALLPGGSINQWRYPFQFYSLTVQIQDSRCVSQPIAQSLSMSRFC